MTGKPQWEEGMLVEHPGYPNRTLKVLATCVDPECAIATVRHNVTGNVVLIGLDAWDWRCITKAELS